MKKPIKKRTTVKKIKSSKISKGKFEQFVKEIARI